MIQAYDYKTMKTFKNLILNRVISIILMIGFLFSDNLYGIELSIKSNLRVPVIDAKRLKDGLNRLNTSSRVVLDSGLPEDIVEIPQKTFRLKPEREITEKIAEIHAAIEIQKDISSIISNLTVLITDALKAETKNDKTAMKQREDLLLEELRNLYKNMPVEIYGNRTYEECRDILKSLKIRREMLYEKLEKAEKEKNTRVLAETNLELIRNNRIIVKIQVLLAGIFLGGKSNLKIDELRRNAALWTLQGSMDSSKKLEDELYFRTQRLRGKQKIAEIETTDWVGRVVRTFRLGGFDVEVSQTKGEEGPSVTVRQQRWINVRTRLASALQAIRRGEREKSLEILGDLIKLYGVEYIVTLETYKDIASDLNAIRKIALGLPESNAPPKETLKDISGKIKDLVKKISHPKHRIWVDIEFDSLEKAFHNDIKKIAGYEPEYLLVLKNKANLEYYAEKLKTASKKNYISNKNRESIKTGIASLKKWTERGFVYPKQFSAIYLHPILALLDKDDFEGAEAYCRKTVKELDKRLGEIDSIISNLKKSAASIYSAYRDEDISKRIDKISSLLNKKAIESALTEIAELREFYFDQELVEPGYIRSEKLLRRITILARSAARRKNQEAIVQNISRAFEEMKQDTAHKYSFKITVTREDGKSRKFFINPGTTALGLLNLKSLQRKPDLTLVSIGKGWIPKEGLGKVKIPEGAQVLLKSKEITPLKEGVLNLVEIHRNDI